MILKCAHSILLGKLSLQKPKSKSIQEISSYSPKIILIIILAILSNNLIGQVRIKEKVKLNPHINLTINDQLKKIDNSNHSLNVVHQWEQLYLGEGNTIPMSRKRFRIKVNSCNEFIYSDYDYSGNLEYNVADLKGSRYTIDLLLSQRTIWDPSYDEESLHGAPFQVYVDGSLYANGTNSISIMPWFGDLGFEINGENISYNDFGNQIYLYTHEACKPILGNLNEDWPNISIIKGQKYISFYDDINDQPIGDSFYSGDLISHGNLPKIIYDFPYYKTDIMDAIVQVDLNGVFVYDTIRVNRDEDFEIEVEIIPETIKPNEQSEINIKKLTSAGKEEFPSSQLFDVVIFEGSEYGTILATNGVDKADSFSEIPQGFKFVAEPNIDLDSVEVIIKVSTIDDDDPFLSKAENSEPNESSKIQTINNVSVSDLTEGKNTTPIKNNPNFIIIPGGETDIYGVGSVKIKKEIIEIMLGETKYFGVKKKENVEEYKIEEIETIYGKKPEFPDDTNQDWKWIKNEDVWGTNPIEKLGSKSGVYWEKKWFDKSNNKNNNFAEAGMIRLVGRFWELGKDDSFKVKLKTIKDTNTEILVVNPDTLLADGVSTSYSKTKDVFNKVINIDSLCIKYGGLYGIPPHMLKGQIFQESAKKNFGGSIGLGFAPSYRYEPYSNTVNRYVNILIKKNENPFLITKDAMGKPGAANVPTKEEHQHLEHDEYFHYFEEYKTVWDIIEEKSRLVDINNTYTTYGFQYIGTAPDTKKKGQIKSGVYGIIGDTFMDYLMGQKNKKSGDRKGNGYLNDIRKKYKLDKSKDLTIAQQTEANDSARLATIRYLKNKYQPSGSKIKGLANIPAQTRVASSYGLLQTLYTVVLDEHKYPVGNNNNPEKLNEVDTSIVYSLKHLKKIFKSLNGFSIDESNSNWNSKYSGNNKVPKFPKPLPGFEEALKVMFYKWNPGYSKDQINAYYHNEILNNSEKFLPRRK